MARARIITTDRGPEVQWDTAASFPFERGNDDSLIVALTKAVNFGIEEGYEIEGDTEKQVAAIIRKAAGDVAWPAGEGYQQLMDKVIEQLPKDENGWSDISVRDISRDGTKALVCSWKNGEEHYIVPLSLHGSGEEEVAVIPPKSEWIPVEQEFVVAKAGRVLSAKNMKLVQAAAEALAALHAAGVIEEAQAADETTKSADPDPNWEGVEYIPLQKEKGDPMRYTMGPLYVPNRKDAHGEWVEDDTLHKAVHDFVRESAETGREINLQHGDKGDVVVGEWVEVARWPYEHTITTKAADGTDHEVEMPEGTVYMGVVWNEEYWDAKNNRPKGIEGLSLGGRAVKVTGGDATMKAMGWKTPTATKKAEVTPEPEAAPDYSDIVTKLAADAATAKAERDAARAERDAVAVASVAAASAEASTRTVLERVMDVFEKRAGAAPGDVHVHLPEQNVVINEDSGLAGLVTPEPEEE